MKLHEIAHARAGDKGNLINVSLIAFSEDSYPLLEKFVTAECVAELFAPLIDGPVERYCIPGLGAMNFVLRRPQTESVTRSLALDAHGKSLSFLLLNMALNCESIADDNEQS